MRLRRKRDAGVALRRPRPGPSPDRMPARPVTPVGAPDPEPPTPPKGRKAPIILAALVAVGIVAAAVAYTVLQDGDEAGGEAAPTPAVVGDSEAVLFVVAGEDGRAVSVALLASNGDDDHRILVAPRDLTMQVPGYGEGTLGEALAIEDAELVRLALVNEIGIRVDETVTIEPGEVAAMLGEAVRIDLPNPFIVNTRDGEVVSASAGSDVFVPETAETLLTTQGADTPLDWLQRQRAVWEALARQVGERPEPATEIAAGFADWPLADAVVSVLPVDRVGVGISELYVVSRDAELLTERIAYLALTDAARPRVEILNATTFPGVTRPLAEALIESGFRIIKTDNADERFRTETLIIAQGVRGQQAALDAQAIVGAGDVVVQSAGSGVVDVSIIVGRDVAAP